MFRKSLAAAGLAAAFMFVPAAAAQALHCENVSRPPAACGAVCTDGPILVGNWAWLPSVFPGAPEAWVFVPPGTVQGFGLPGEDGNFQSGDGVALLVNAICDSEGKVLVHRQVEHGIQLMEDACEAAH
ncbi:hypothetical protein J2X42_000331 [Arthrobacter sp. BE255]|nr:hypothetical protein [Arthrobacter sp. BE255]